MLNRMRVLIPGRYVDFFKHVVTLCHNVNYIMMLLQVNVTAIYNMQGLNLRINISFDINQLHNKI